MNREGLLNIFSKIPKIETDRLILREMRKDDANDMFEYASKLALTEYLLWSPHPSVNYTRDYLKSVEARYAIGDFSDWAVTLKDSGKMIGTCGFTRIDLRHNLGEMGYVLNPEYHRKGLGYEAASAVMEFGFKRLGLKRIEIRYMDGNVASKNLAEKLGMSFEGIMRSFLLVKGKYRDIGVYSILREEFES